MREVHEVIACLRDIGYTTVLKQMQVMFQKGLLRREERYRSHVYTPAHPRSATQRLLAGHLLRHAFDGSASRRLQSALAGRRVSADELEEIRGLLAQFEKRGRS